jgi:hypothetical protein
MQVGPHYNLLKVLGASAKTGQLPELIEEGAVKRVQ